MTDLIERVDAAFSETAGDARRRQHLSRAAGTDAVGTTRPLHILLAVSLGGSAILLFAMSSGHLHGARATVGVVAALAQVAFAVGALTRPSRALFGVVAAGNVGDRRFLAGRRRPADGVRGDRRHRRGAVGHRRCSWPPRWPSGRRSAARGRRRPRSSARSSPSPWQPWRSRASSSPRPPWPPRRRRPRPPPPAVRPPLSRLRARSRSPARAPRRFRASWPATARSSRSSRSGCRSAPRTRPYSPTSCRRPSRRPSASRPLRPPRRPG